jgi:hypothetical protein
MGTLPKPLIGLLLGTVAFFAIWMVALKPHSSSSGGSQGGVGQYQGAIDKAHQAVTTSNQANAKLGAPTSTTSATTPAATTPAATTPAATTLATKAQAKPVTKAKATPTTKPTTKPATQPSSDAATNAPQTVATAIRAGKVVAILFYNDAAPDDRAVKSELAAIPTHGGQVVKVAVPLSQLIQFSSLTQTVDVNTAPELVLIDHARQASTLVGYADGVEIAQRIDDALASK